MTYVRADRQYKMLSAAYSEFPTQAVLKCKPAALGGLVRTLRQQAAERLSKEGECPFQEKEDYGWNDGAIPSIRESGSPGSQERINALAEWYAHQAKVEEFDGGDIGCSSAFIPGCNQPVNAPRSDSSFSRSPLDEWSNE